MPDYNYMEAVYDDIEAYIDGYLKYALPDCYDSTYNELDRNALFDVLYDDMFIDDYITGNASGSYTFNTYKAEEYICHNWELLEEALISYGYECSINILDKGAEWCDVIIRCYLLPEALQKAIDKHADEWEERIINSHIERSGNID